MGKKQKKPVSVELRLSNEYVRLSYESVERLNEKARKNGGLLVEFGNPKLPDFAGPKERLTRYRYVDESRVCARITELWLDTNDHVIGRVQAEGPMAQFVEVAIKNNGGERLRFGLRSMVGEGNVMEIIGYDLINFG